MKRKIEGSQGPSKRQKVDPFKIIEGDLLEHKQDYLIHQTNCIAIKYHGLSEQVFKKYPEANLYEKRRKIQKKGGNKFVGRGVPGTIQVHDCGVINLIGQYYTGTARFPPKDTPEKRFKWFKRCLKRLSIHFKDKETSIAFPYKIGCGLAGGDWKKYRKAIEDFCLDNGNIKMVMYKLD